VRLQQRRGIQVFFKRCEVHEAWSSEFAGHSDPDSGRALPETVR
jgi:hypothetical protein